MSWKFLGFGPTGVFFHFPTFSILKKRKGSLRRNSRFLSLALSSLGWFRLLRSGLDVFETFFIQWVLYRVGCPCPLSYRSQAWRSGRALWGKMEEFCRFHHLFSVLSSSRWTGSFYDTHFLWLLECPSFVQHPISSLCKFRDLPRTE